MRSYIIFLILNLTVPVVPFAQLDSLSNDIDSTDQDSLVVHTGNHADSLVSGSPEGISPDSSRLAESVAMEDSLNTIDRLKVRARDNRELKDGAIRVVVGKDYLFYFLIFLLLLFGLMRRVFSKYFYDFFRVFFRTTIKQRQLGEQLEQAFLPSFLLNFFFVIIAGLYINLLLIHYDISLSVNFWLQFIYCASGLAAIYLIKYTGLRLTGYLFNIREVSEEYSFIVFSVNKMIGIVLLPFVLVMSFSTNKVFLFALVLSFTILILLLVYRFVMAFRAVRKEIRLNPFHFILYILAFETIPLLLLYKLLLRLF